MKARPSLWNLRPLGQPSYCTTRSHSCCGEMRKMRPNGMSTIQRLPSRSNDGSSSLAVRRDYAESYRRTLVSTLMVNLEHSSSVCQCVFGLSRTARTVMGRTPLIPGLRPDVQATLASEERCEV